jgi:hypothetical protein
VSDEQDKEAKKGKKGKGGDASDGALRLTTHQNAQRLIRTAKGWGGVVPFFLVLALALRADVPLEVAAMRAVAAGMAGLLLAWGAGIAVARQLVLADLERHRRRLLAAREGAEAAS